MTYSVLGNPDYKFGDTSRLYGLPTEDTTHWSCEVDWDGDGVYTGESENSYMIGFNSRRGRRTFLEINGEGVASGESRDEMEMAKVAGNACGMATHAMYGSFHKPWPAIGR